RVALRRVLGVEVDGRVHEGLDTVPEDRGGVEGGGDPEGAGALEVVLAAGGEAHLQADRGAQPVEVRQLVLETQQEVAGTDGVTIAEPVPRRPAVGGEGA